MENTINEKFGEKLEEIYCSNCKKKTKHSTISKVIHFPEIFIMYSKNNENFTSDYQTMKNKNEEYNLVCFIINRNEQGNEVDYFNVFYKINKSWFVFNVKSKINKIVEDIKKIKGTPLVIFLQKDKTLFNNYYNYIKLLLNDQFNTRKLIKAHLLNEMEYKQYYIVNGKVFNKIIKIYQSKEKFDDENYFMHSINDLVNIKKLKNSELKTKYLEFLERKHYIKDLTGITYQENKIEGEIYKFPKDFVIIKKDLLDDLFDKFSISKDKLQNNLYKILFGEGFAFIKDKVKENEKEIILVCALNENNFSFNIITLFVYESKNNFLAESGNYICNRGGLEYYYQKRDLILEQKILRTIQDKDKKSNILKLYNIEEMNNYINEFKLKKDKKIQVNNEPEFLGGGEKKIKTFDDIKTVESISLCLYQQLSKNSSFNQKQNDLNNNPNIINNNFMNMNNNNPLYNNNMNCNFNNNNNFNNQDFSNQMLYNNQLMNNMINNNYNNGDNNFMNNQMNQIINNNNQNNNFQNNNLGNNINNFDYNQNINNNINNNMNWNINNNIYNNMNNNNNNNYTN